MKKKINIFKSIGFKFSYRRLKKAILLVLLYVLIGVGVWTFYEYENSESGLKKIYTKEVSSFYDIGDKKRVKIIKRNEVGDDTLDYILLVGTESRSNEDNLNSTVELYKDVNLVIIDGNTKENFVYDSQKDFKSNVKLRVVEDSSNKYFMASDESGNILLLAFRDNNFVDIIKNTTQNDFLGYTIYTSQDSENPKVLDVRIDNFSKDYLASHEETEKLDFSDKNIDLSSYRETYLRDNFSNFELKDTNNDGVLELVATQKILYCLDDKSEEKTTGQVVTTFNITQDKLVFQGVDIHI